LYLVQQGLLDLPVLYLSRYIIENKSEYYRRLRMVTQNQDWEPWILYMLEAVENTAVFTRRRILEIRELMANTVDIVRERLPGIYTKELVESLFSHPYTKVQFLVNEGLAKRQTAAAYLRQLQTIGVLQSFKAGRENIFLNVRLYDLLSK
jgi:Fic family protein